MVSDIRDESFGFQEESWWYFMVGHCSIILLIKEIVPLYLH